MKSDFGICTVPGRVASATTIAVGEERTRGSDAGGTCRVAAQPTQADGAGGAATRHVRVFAVPWVPRRLVTHGYCCVGATRPLWREVQLDILDGMRCAATHVGQSGRKMRRLKLPKSASVAKSSKLANP